MTFHSSFENCPPNAIEEISKKKANIHINQMKNNKLMNRFLNGYWNYHCHIRIVKVIVMHRQQYNEIIKHTQKKTLSQHRMRSNNDFSKHG